MPAPSAETLAARRGAAYLIEHNGPDAIRNLDAGRFDIVSLTDCALGQTYGSYTRAPFYFVRLPDWVEPTQLGFYPAGKYWPEYSQSTRRLNRAWKRIIRKAQQESN